MKYTKQVPLSIAHCEIDAGFLRKIIKYLAEYIFISKQQQQTRQIAVVSTHASQMLQSSMGRNVHKNMERGTGRRHLSLVNMKKRRRRNVA